MSRVAERADAGLIGALVEAGLETDVALVGAQLLLAELALVLLRHFRPESRTRVLRVLLSLRSFKHATSLPSQVLPN